MRIFLGSALALSLSGISIACCYVFGTHLAPGSEGQLYGVLGGTAGLFLDVVEGFQGLPGVAGPGIAAQLLVVGGKILMRDGTGQRWIHRSFF